MPNWTSVPLLRTIVRPLSSMLCFTRSLQIMAERRPEEQHHLDDMVVWASQNNYNGIVDVCSHKSPMAMHKVDEHYRNLIEPQIAEITIDTVGIFESRPQTVDEWRLRFQEFRAKANCFKEQDDVAKKEHL